MRFSLSQRWYLAVGTLFFALAVAWSGVKGTHQAAARLEAVRHGQSAGRGLVVVYSGDSRCDWCRDPRLPSLLRKVNDRIRVIADSAGIGYRMVGVAVDPIPEDGWRYIRGLGPFFLEIAGGGGWQGLGITGLGADSVLGGESTPQLLVLDRVVSDARTDSLVPHTRIRRQEVVVRLIGVQELVDWVNDGEPLTLAPMPDGFGRQSP